MNLEFLARFFFVFVSFLSVLRVPPFQAIFLRVSSPISQYSTPYSHDANADSTKLSYTKWFYTRKSFRIAAFEGEITNSFPSFRLLRFLLRFLRRWGQLPLVSDNLSLPLLSFSSPRLRFLTNYACVYRVLCSTVEIQLDQRKMASISSWFMQQRKYELCIRWNA